LGAIVVLGLAFDRTFTYPVNRHFLSQNFRSLIKQILLLGLLAGQCRFAYSNG